jgi:hypothetical protein
VILTKKATGYSFLLSINADILHKEVVLSKTNDMHIPSSATSSFGNKQVNAGVLKL